MRWTRLWQLVVARRREALRRGNQVRASVVYRRIETVFATWLVRAKQRENMRQQVLLFHLRRATQRRAAVIDLWRRCALMRAAFRREAEVVREAQILRRIARAFGAWVLERADMRRLRD